MRRNYINKHIYRTIIAVIVCFIVCPIVAISFMRSNSYSSLGTSNRTMIDAKVKCIANFEFLFSGAIPKVYKGFVYLINYNQQSIDKLDMQGKVLQSFGRLGKGPGEFQHIDNFDINDQSIAIIDNNLGIISEFNHNGSPQKFYRHSKKIGHGIRTGYRTYLLKVDGSFGTTNEEEFQLINIDSNSQKKIIVKRLYNQNSNEFTRDFISDGLFISNAKGQISRISSRVGAFIGFDSQGKVLYNKPTIDETPPPTLPFQSHNSNGGKDIFISFDGIRIINLAFAADERYLYVLSNAASPNIKDKALNITDQRIIDVYNINTGNYTFSFQMPKFQDKRVTDIFVSNGELYACHGQYLCKYTFKIP
jgi:hypothetical protein